MSSSSEEEEDDVRRKKTEEDPCCSSRCLLCQVNLICMYVCASHVYFLNVKNKPHDELGVVRNFSQPLTMCSLTFCLVGCKHSYSISVQCSLFSVISNVIIHIRSCEQCSSVYVSVFTYFSLHSHIFRCVNPLTFVRVLIPFICFTVHIFRC